MTKKYLWSFSALALKSLFFGALFFRSHCHDNLTSKSTERTIHMFCYFIYKPEFTAGNMQSLHGHRETNEEQEESIEKAFELTDSQWTKTSNKKHTFQVCSPLSYFEIAISGSMAPSPLMLPYNTAHICFPLTRSLTLTICYLPSILIVGKQ